MTAVVTIPLKVTCAKCGWTETLTLEKHGPQVPGLFWFVGGSELANRPKTCPDCNAGELTVRRGPIFQIEDFRVVDGGD